MDGFLVISLELGIAVFVAGEPVKIARKTGVRRTKIIELCIIVDWYGKYQFFDRFIFRRYKCVMLFPRPVIYRAGRQGQREKRAVDAIQTNV
jgi:hypothetical protein